MSSLILAGYDLLSPASVVQLARDSDLGSPQALTETVDRLLTDGALVTGVRSGNRELSLPLWIVGDRATVAQAIADVAAFLDQRTYTITWQPGDGLPVTFDCYRGQLTRNYDLGAETQGVAGFTATIPALPFTRTPTPVRLSPASSSGQSLQVDALNDTTGLTTTGSATVTADTGTKIEGTASVKSAFTVPGGSGSGTSGSPFVAGVFGESWSRTIASTDLSGYVLFGPRVHADRSMTATWTLTLAGTGWSATYQLTAARQGWQVLGFDLTSPVSTTGTVDLTAVTSWALGFSVSNWGSAYTAVLWLDDLKAFKTGSGAISTPSGTARYDNVLGSARTPVSVEVACVASNAFEVMSRLLVARFPDPPPGFDPILTSASGTADTTAFSGALKTSFTVTRPAYSLRGTYAVMVRAKPASACTFTVTSQITGDSTVVETRSRTYSTAQITAMSGGTTHYNWFPIGAITLPPREIDGSNTTTTVTITITSSVVGIVDQAYLTDLAGDCVFVDPPQTGTYFRGIYIDAPTGGEAAGKVLASTDTGGARRSDAVSLTPWLRSAQAIVNFTPGSNLLLVVAEPGPGFSSVNWPAPQVTAVYYPRWAAERAV